MNRRRTVFIIACAVLFGSAPLGPPTSTASCCQTNVPVKMRDGVTLRADIYRPAHDGQVPRAAPAHALQQGRRARASASRRRARLRRHHPGRARPLCVRGRVVPVQARAERRLRHGGVGGGAALFERQGRDVRRVVRRRDADAGGHRASAAPRRNLPRRHGQQLPLELDVSGRRVRAVVQPVVDVGARAGHVRPQHARQARNALKGMWQLPLGSFPLFNPPADGRPPEATATLAPYYLDWLAHPELRRLLEAVVDRGALRRHHGADAARSRRGTTSSRTARCATTSASRRTAATRPRATGSTLHHRLSAGTRATGR